MKKLVIFLDEHEATYDDVLSSIYAILDYYGFILQKKFKYVLENANLDKTTENSKE